MPQTVDRALEILQLVADRPQSLGNLASHLQVSKSTALRLAQSLERAGLVWKADNGRYKLGSTILTLASKALESYDIRDVARPFLTRLNQMSGHTVHLASLMDRAAIYVDKYEGNTAIRMWTRVGMKVSLYTSGVGKAILAHQTAPVMTELMAHIEFQRHTPRTITNELDLRNELAKIRERGWAYDDGEFEDTVHCIAAPIYMADGSVTSAVSISAPRLVPSSEALTRFLPYLLDATNDISHASGWSGDTRPRTAVTVDEPLEVREGAGATR